jgi:hypothetical protein
VPCRRPSAIGRVHGTIRRLADTFKVYHGGCWYVSYATLSSRVRLGNRSGAAVRHACSVGRTALSTGSGRFRFRYVLHPPDGQVQPLAAGALLTLPVVSGGQSGLPVSCRVQATRCQLRTVCCQFTITPRTPKHPPRHPNIAAMMAARRWGLTAAHPMSLGQPEPSLAGSPRLSGLAFAPLSGGTWARI